MYYFILIIIVLIIVLVLLTSNLIKKSKLIKIQRKKVESFKKKNDLNNNELDIFKNVMRETRDLINSFEKNLEQNIGFQKEVKVEEALIESKAIFEYLMHHPKDLIEFGDFLYKILPTIVEAGNELNQIENNKINSPLIKQDVKEIKSLVLAQSELIKANYEQIVKDQTEQLRINKDASEMAGIR